MWKEYCLFLALSAFWHTTLSRADYAYKSGPFTIVYQSEKRPALQVYREGRGSRPVWYTPNNTLPFVSAAKIQEDIKQDGGNFVFSFKSLENCTEMKITDNGTRPGVYYPEVYFSGDLCGKAPFELGFEAVGVPDGDETRFHLTFNLTLLNTSEYNELRLTYGCESDEEFYGFGAQYSRVDMKGKRIPLFLSEQGVGRGLQPLTGILDFFSPGAGGTWYTTYTRVPHYITNYQRSLVLESLEYAVFDMTRKDSVTIELHGDTLFGRIITGNSSLELITSYTAFAGRLKPLPDWVGKGAVLGLQGGTDAVLGTIEQVQKVWGNLSDVTAVWLQDWTGQRNFSGTKDLPRTGLWWNWEVDTTHYPNWTNLISTLNSKDIKTLTYINCMLSDVSQRGTPYTHNYYQEAVDAGYVVRNPDGSIWTGYSNSTMVDLSNPEAYQWMINIIVKNMLHPGVCGWMLDFGESVPLNAKLRNGQDPQKFHSLYPSIWGQLNADAVGNASSILNSNSSVCSADDVVYFMRSGNIHSPQVASSFWLGDQLVTWDFYDGMATAITGMITEGLSGYSLTHSDIGGYTAIHKTNFLKYVRTKELFLRWCELAAFTTMYRSHLGTLPDENWQFNSDTETLKHFFNMTIVFQSWGFYREQLMEEAYNYGWPVVRHMMLVFPNHSNVYTENLGYQYMLGTELLVAPCYTRGDIAVKVWLPGNVTWVHVWTNSTYHQETDGWFTIESLIGEPCVLYPQGSQVGERFVKNLKERKLL